MVLLQQFKISDSSRSWRQLCKPLHHPGNPSSRVRANNLNVMYQHWKPLQLMAALDRCMHALCSPLGVCAITGPVGGSSSPLRLP